MRKYIIGFISLLAVCATANITVDYQLAYLNDSTGTAVSQGTIAAFYIDLNGNGLSGITSSTVTDSFLFDAGDLLIGTDVSSAADGAFLSADGFLDELGRMDNAIGALTSELTANGGSVNGQDVYMLWFPELTIGTPGENQSYGFYNLGSLPTADGQALTDLNSGLDLNAQYQTVPEPATALLAVIGGALAYGLRRRGHKFVC